MQGTKNWLQDKIKIIYYMSYLKILLLSIIIIFFLSNKIIAQTFDSSHYDWTVWEYEEDTENKKCYITSFSKRSNTNHPSNRKPFIMITKYSNNKREEVMVNSDYEIKLNSDIYLLINDKKLFHLFPKGNMGWIRGTKNNKQLIQDMLFGTFLKIRTDSAFNTYAIDEYSLRGIAKAYKRMKDLCDD